MNTVLLQVACVLSAGVLCAQMPSSFDASGQSAQGGVQQNDPNSVGETANPKLLGMEVPLLDPSNDSIKYNGARIDVGNNALVRARFERYLNQLPDDSSEAKAYRKLINNLLKLTRRYSRNRDQVGSGTLVAIGKHLYEANEYAADNGQSGVLASAIVSALDAQRGNRDRKAENKELDAEIDKLVYKTNLYTNRNLAAEAPKSPTGGIKVPAQTSRHASNTFVIARNTQKIAANEAIKVKNDASNQMTLEMAKLNYQGTLVYLFTQRYFDHAVIGSRIYRHVFRDGDTSLQLDEKSDASQMFVGVTGMPPSVSTVDSLASTARSDVEKSMESVRNMLDQNRLSEATQHLIEAVALGEYMQCVATFPVKDRQRVAKFWNLRKRSLTALNARDYGTLEAMADEMKAMDADFDDTQLRAYCAGKMQQSNLCLFNAKAAMEKGNMEEFNRQITNAGIIWPRNPRLLKGQEDLERLSNQSPVRDEFRTLYARQDFRTIAKEQDKFEVVATDPELKKQYKEAITVVETINGMLTQLEAVSAQDKVIGPCLAYETLLEQRRSHEVYAKDMVFLEAFNNYANRAHDFVDALREAEDCEKRGEYGSALAGYYRARCFHPQSHLADAGAKRVEKMIAEAAY